MAKKAATVDDLLSAALRTASEADGEVKLKGTGGLFKDAEGLRGTAIELLKAQDRPLVEVVRTTTGRGAAEFVRLTLAGMARLIELTPRAEVGPFVVEYARRLTEENRNKLLSELESRTSGPAAEQYTEALTAVEREAVRVAEERAEATAQAQIERYEQKAKLKDAEATRKEREAAADRAEAEGLRLTVTKIQAARPRPTPQPEPAPESEQKSPSKPIAKGVTAEPRTDEEKDFRRDVVRQLAETWRAAANEDRHEARDYLETAMWNVAGIRMVGEANAQVAYNGRHHESADSVFPGDAVKVVRPGWAVKEGEHDHVVVKAVVKKL